jgi:protein O-GlcNAc transferase
MSIREQLDSAMAHHRAGRLAEAEKLYRAVLALDTNQADALNMLGALAGEAGRLDEAVELIGRAAKIKPDSPLVLNNLGTTLAKCGRIEEAISVFGKVIRLKPNYPDAHYNLGNVLRETERLEDAVAAFRQCLRLKPNHAEAHNNLGSTLKKLGLLDEAIAGFREAIRLKPEYVEAHSNLVFAMYFDPKYDAGMIRDESDRWNRQHAESFRKFIRRHTNERNENRRLRIGYVSPDFRNHSVSRFLLPLFREHDHRVIEVFCYSDVERTDDFTDRLRACADRWVDIAGRSDERAVNQVREDQIDVLIDLAGHTSGNRLQMFARKPAPVQISYLGYPGSTGVAEIDYRLTDALADPVGGSERLLRLPVCNWCFNEPEDAPPVGPLPAESNGFVRFGSFNNFAKASPLVMDLWARILNGVEGSRLMIKSRGLGEPGVRDRIRRSFGDRGISSDRLEIRGHESSVASHLGAYNRMDIALDSFPYHGTTTTCEALWMGVPVVSLAGQTHVSRVGASLLNSVGLPEFIAQTTKQYVEIAIELAKDLPRLAELRRTLRPRIRVSPLMDASRLARDIENAYRKMWRNWCAQSGNSGIQCPVI